VFPCSLLFFFQLELEKFHLPAPIFSAALQVDKKSTLVDSKSVAGGVKLDTDMRPRRGRIFEKNEKSPEFGRDPVARQLGAPSPPRAQVVFISVSICCCHHFNFT